LRTFAFGDIHGDLDALNIVLSKLPPLSHDDTLVFLGDYVDRGPASRQVIERIIGLGKTAPAKIVALRGNHEDGWLRVRGGAWPDFVIPASNGCAATYRSFKGEDASEQRMLEPGELLEMSSAMFFPEDVLHWMQNLPYYYEDEHALYVHAGVEKGPDGVWLHPRDVAPQAKLLWLRTAEFFREYQGKRIVVGHTSTDHLPPELSMFTPDDPRDMWVKDNVYAIDTGAGKGGFLTALELPAARVYESREVDLRSSKY
jgi:serine/threonine protein phosphatase 1